MNIQEKKYINAIPHTEYCTNDYDLFHLFESDANRTIQQGHVDELCKSLKYKDMLIDTAILVAPHDTIRGHYYILEGQHRWAAAKKMNLPLYFKIAKKMSVKDIGVLNSFVSKWKTSDYFRIYSNYYVSYKEIKDIATISGLTENQVLKILNIHANSDFKLGNLTLPEEFDYYATLLLCKSISEIYNLFPKDKNFHNLKIIPAIKTLVKHPNYNHRKMVSQMKGKAKDLIVPKGSTPQYVELLFQVYNHNIRDYGSRLFTGGYHA